MDGGLAFVSMSVPVAAWFQAFAMLGIGRAVGLNGDPLLKPFNPSHA